MRGKTSQQHALLRWQHIQRGRPGRGIVEQRQLPRRIADPLVRFPARGLLRFQRRDAARDCLSLTHWAEAATTSNSTVGATAYCGGSAYTAVE